MHRSSIESSPSIATESVLQKGELAIQPIAICIILNHGRNLLRASPEFCNDVPALETCRLDQCELLSYSAAMTYL